MLQPTPCGPILVVDDDHALREHLVGLLEAAGFTTVGASSGDGALAAARERPPQAVVLDVCLPGLSGYEVCRALKEADAGLPVIFISGERVESFDRVAGLLLGGDDYLVKPFAEDELLARVRALLRRAVQAPQRGPHGLTRRELEVLGQLADGLGQNDIARQLVISPKTVATHIEHIFQKLGVRSRAQAVAAAYREHLVEDVEAHQLTAQPSLGAGRAPPARRPAAASIVKEVIEQLPFGSTGHVSTRTLFGAAALGEASQDEADRALELLLAHGVNHIDTAASYGDAELRIGPWMRGHRADFFLATKTGEREYGPAREQIRRSLELLQTDQVDLIQLHNLVDAREWEVALGPGGALEAAVEARDEGLVRFIGVTGHGADVAERHRASLERFPFDSVLLPYNWTVMQDTRYAADFETLLALCEARGVAVQTIKSNARRLWQTDPHPPGPWYEPLTEQDAIDTAVAWVLGRPHVFMNTTADLQLLPKVLDAAARAGERPSDAEMEALAERESLENLFAGAIPI